MGPANELRTYGKPRYTLWRRVPCIFKRREHTFQYATSRVRGEWLGGLYEIEVDAARSWRPRHGPGLGLRMGRRRPGPALGVRLQPGRSLSDHLRCARLHCRSHVLSAPGPG